jgi:hypothetical protein
LKKRGIVLVLVGIPARIYWLRELAEVRRSPFGYEFGSVAFPVPTYLRAIGLFAVCSILIGLFLIAFDFVQWLRRKRNAVSH